MLSRCNYKVFYRQKGFNLLELLVVLGILAITLGVLVPSGKNMLEKSRLIGATNETYSALLYTRNEATRLRVDAKLCFIESAMATVCANKETKLLGIFVTEKDKPKKLLPNNYEIEEKVSLSFVGVKKEEPIQIGFASLGNRQSRDEDVYLEITTDSLTRQIEICFNGRIVIREKQDVSECR